MLLPLLLLLPVVRSGFRNATFPPPPPPMAAAAAEGKVPGVSVLDQDDEVVDDLSVSSAVASVDDSQSVVVVVLEVLQ